MNGNTTGRRPVRRTAGWLAALILAVSGAVMIKGSLGDGGPDGTLTDMHGNQVTISGGGIPSEDLTRRMNVGQGAGATVIVPAVGLTVPLGELSAVDGEITPPGFAEIYHVRNRGVSLDQAGSGTVYLVTHSVVGGYAPGNAVMDPADGRSLLTPGDSIDVSGLRYRVASHELVVKDDLPGLPGVWNDAAGRLVFITCLIRGNAETSENLVVTAMLEGPSVDGD